MGVNVIQVLQNAVDSELAAQIKAALDADAIEDEAVLKAKDDAIAGLQGQVDALATQIEELKKLEGANYDLQKQLQVKTAENDLLRQRIAQLEAGNPAPEPEPEPEPEQPPVSTPAWPKSGDTGVPVGTKLTNYKGPTTISTNGYVIEDKIINGTITVEASNVIIRRCQITMNGHYGIVQMGGSNLLVEDCEIRGVNSHRMTGIAIAGGTVRRCNIHGMVIGIAIWDTSVIEDCYIHDLVERSNNPDDRHFDGIACLGGSTGTIIRRNAIIMPPAAGGTAAVFLSSQNAAISNIKVLNNLLTGQPSYQAYAERASKAMSGVVFDGNYIEKGIHGYILNNSGAADINNVKWDDATQAAPAPVQAWRGAP